MKKTYYIERYCIYRNEHQLYYFDAGDAIDGDDASEVVAEFKSLEEAKEEFYSFDYEPSLEKIIDGKFQYYKVYEYALWEKDTWDEGTEDEDSTYTMLETREVKLHRVYKLCKSQVDIDGYVLLEQGCTLDEEGRTEEILESFDSSYEAELALREHKSTIMTVDPEKSCHRITEFYLLENIFDDDNCFSSNQIYKYGNGDFDSLDD